MPRYHYHALNSDGVSLEGMLRADNERDVARQLERRGLSVIEVRSGEAAGRERGGRLRHGDVILALQELATMLTSGVSIADAVGSQALGAHHPRIVAAFAGMSRDLQRGQAFSATLAKCGLPLPEYVVQLARAGEMTGELGKALREPMNALFMLAAAMILNWKLSMVFLGGAPFVLALLGTFGSKMKRATRRSLEASAQMLATLQEAVAGLRVEQHGVDGQRIDLPLPPVATLAPMLVWRSQALEHQAFDAARAAAFAQRCGLVP